MISPYTIYSCINGKSYSVACRGLVYVKLKLCNFVMVLDLKQVIDNCSLIGVSNKSSLNNAYKISKNSMKKNKHSEFKNIFVFLSVSAFFASTFLYNLDSNAAQSTSNSSQTSSNSTFKSTAATNNLSSDISGKDIKKHVEGLSINEARTLVNETMLDVTKGIDSEITSAKTQDYIDDTGSMPDALNKIALRSYVKTANSDTQLLIGGSLNVQYGMVSQESPFKIAKDKNFYCNLAGSSRCNGSQQALATDGKLMFSILRQSGNGTDYGVVLKLNVNPSIETDGSSTDADRTYVFIQNPQWGRVEAGSNDGAGNLLKVAPLKIARATGGIDGDWSNWVYALAYDTNDNNFPKTNLSSMFVTAPYLPYSLDAKKKANKITYLTPQIRGWSFGVSYIPDVNFVGTSYEARKVWQKEYKNVLDMAARYQYSLNKNTLLQFSAIAEVGKARSFVYDDTNAQGTVETKTANRNNLKAWELGAQLSYKNLSMAVAYADQGKSGMLSDRELDYGMKKQSKFASFGVAYVQDKLGMSMTCMRGRSAGKIATYTVKSTTTGDSSVTTKFAGYVNDGVVHPSVDGGKKYNTLDLLSLGVDYQLLEGIMPYVEVTRFKVKSPIPTIVANKGSVLLVGTKISF